MTFGALMAIMCVCVCVCLCVTCRREQSLDKKYPGVFQKHHSSRQSGSSNSMEKLMKKRNVPQKLPIHSKRCVSV